MDIRVCVRWAAVAAVTAAVPFGPGIGTAFGLAHGQDETSEDKSHEDEAPTLGASTFSAIKARSIGPALMSGRIGDLAVNPNNHSEFYVAVSSGNVWKTTNKGTTFKPVFDGEGSYSIGCVAIDPTNTSVVWVGSGENNSQRSVSFGDGVYKSIDGGASWS
ncbi:MAG: hypothetical protein AAF235_06420, partial [Planctomycetota bacterium]